MTTKEILQSAYAILEKPHAWGKGKYEASTPYGTRYCLHGAVRNVDRWGGGSAESFLSKLGYSIEWNDKRTTTKAMVLKALKHAIRKAA